MARNEEKAQSMLNRYLAHKSEEKRGPKEKRPYLASECHDLHEADKWRQQILREVGRKVMEIQNAGLGEHRIRDLNDEINKLIREKGHWERRIVELGGPDYSKTAPKITDSQGREIAEATGKGAGYRYFGAAKNLPGVKELFEAEPVKMARRTRHDMFKKINGDYYGFRDDEDGVLVRVEAEAQAFLQAQALAEWREKEAERQAVLATTTGRTDGGPAGRTAAGGMTSSSYGDGEDEASMFVAYVPLPDSKEIERRVLEKKKAELMAKYTSSTLASTQAEAKALLNKR